MRRDRALLNEKNLPSTIEAQVFYRVYCETIADLLVEQPAVSSCRGWYL